MPEPTLNERIAKVKGFSGYVEGLTRDWQHSIADAWELVEEAGRFSFSQHLAFYDALRSALDDDHEEDLRGESLLWPNCLHMLKPKHICLAYLAVMEQARTPEDTPSPAC